MPIKADSYVPTLAIRASEMNGLEFLPALSKDRMFPCFLLAPWSSARTLGSAMERIQRAFPHRKFFLDIDRDYTPTNAESPSQGQWLELKNPDDHYAAWWRFWIEYPNVVPCLQLEQQSADDIHSQVRDIQSTGREFCFRIELSRRPRNLAQIVDMLCEVGTADYSVIIEGGWTDDPLSLSAHFHGLINEILAPLDGRIPIVLSCTSMPKGFHNLRAGVSEVGFSNRELIAQVQRNTNRELIIYGDWGSTRPREAGFGRPPLPRIDYPTDRTWLIARDRDEDWSYQDAARAIIENDGWNGELGIWGEQLIRFTADGHEFAINTPPKNVACRVNIHLHRQALFGQPIAGIDLDEAWIDDF